MRSVDSSIVLTTNRGRHNCVPQGWWKEKLGFISVYTDKFIDITKVTSKSYSPLWCFDFRSFYLETLWHCDIAISLMHRGQYSTKLMTIFDNSQILLSGSNAIRCAGPSTRKGIALSVLGECCCINSTAPPPPTPHPHPSGQYDRYFVDDIFRCISLKEKFYILIEISLKFVPRGPILFR